jgi:hypothetical protein
MCRYTIPELLFDPELYIRGYQCVLYPFNLLHFF